MKSAFIIAVLVGISQICYSQVYVEKKTRHRFAQLNFGVDFQANFGGYTRYLDSKKVTQTLNLNNGYSSRLLIGGTHFWGHADFYIAIPLFSPTFKQDNQEISAHRGVETVFKYYPLRIENNKIRPFMGASLAPFYFRHQNNYDRHPGGPKINHTSFPLHTGLTFNAKNHLFELGLAWNYQNEQHYYISRTQIEKINTPPVYATFSYKYMLETTLSAEKDWESGRTKEVTNLLAERGRLNGFYIGAGISSAFWLKQSSYNKLDRPFIGKYNISIMPDFTLGYYLHKADLNIAIGYRGYGASANTYGAVQQLGRQSFLFEVAKYLFDYHGFVPFFGPAISHENLSFKEDFEGQRTLNIKEQKLGYGLTFGWDIRPNRIQSWILRTNLRWYPNLFLDVEPNLKISFDNLEFNFIQLIIFPNRIVKRKPHS